MATLTSTKSVFQEIAELGGEMIVRGLTKKHFFQLTARYPELLMEREKNGNIVIMAPVLGGSGSRENDLSYYLTDWSKKQKLGMVFSPSTGFDLPDGSTKSPDIAWLSDERLAPLSSEQIENAFIPIAPDFVAEIRSRTDALKKLKTKMAETWIANGVRLAWLIDPYQEKAYIYRTDGSVEVVTDFDGQLSGENVLPGFSLELSTFRLLGKKG